MKKSILVWLSVVFLFVITACGSGAGTHENTDSVQEETTEEAAETGYIEQPGVTFYLPEGWQLETVDENGVYSYTSSDINCVLRAEYIETDSQIDLTVTDSAVRDMVKDGWDEISDSVEEEKISDTSYLYKGTDHEDNSYHQEYVMDAYNGVFDFYFISDLDTLDKSDYENYFLALIKTIELTGTSPK